MTHARFVGTDQASDGVVLMKIVQVLRTLMLSPEGSALTNESVCEVMLSCFRICFEPRLNELLRRTAEQALKDIILLLFMRLPQFAEERHVSGLIKKLKMTANGVTEQTRRRKLSKASSKHVSLAAAKPAALPVIIASIDDCQASPSQLLSVKKDTVLATTPSTPVVGNIVDMQGKFMQTPQRPLNDDESKQSEPEKPPESVQREDSVENDADAEEEAEEGVKAVDAAEAKPAEGLPIEGDGAKGEDFVNSMGVRFTPQSENGALTHEH